MASSDMNVDRYCQTTVNFTNYVTVQPNLKYSQQRSRLYNIWKEQMVCLLDSQGLLGVVDGETLQPLRADDDNTCRRRDRVVKGWILGSIGEDALDAVVGLKTARDVWLELEKIFTRDDDDDDSSDSIQLMPRNEVTEPSVICGGPAADSHSSSSDDEETDADRSKTTHKSAIRLRRRLKQKWVAPEGENWLYKAALRGDWEAAERLFEEDMERSKAVISCRLETPLHAAVGAGKANNYFVRKLLELLPDEAVALKDCREETALHYAARVGNLEAAVMLVDRKPDLLYMTNNSERLPVQIAAIHCHKEILTYLIRMSKSDVENSPFVGNLGVRLLMAVIASEFFDVALELVEKYPDLSRSSSDGESALSTIVGMSSAFPDGESFSWWHNFIYSCIPLESSTWRFDWTVSTTSDIENHIDDQNCRKSSCFRITYGVSQKLGAMICQALQHLVPQAKDIARKKVMHEQAVQLVRCLCHKTGSLPHKEAAAIYEKSIILAAKYGIHEVVRVIIEIFPTSIFAEDSENGRNIFLLAARRRLHTVFNLIYSLSDRKYNFYDSVDNWDNNLIHLCAKIAPPHKLDIVPGAALQMQRELQWFKEMEKFVHPSRREWSNKGNYTPKELFSEEHRELKAEGETWMRTTANSCSIAAALIATVVFAAAFTVPGGVGSESGVPIFRDKPYFLLFVVSDAVSLFTSLTSLLMFLSIMTSRYAEEDFLYVLPKRLSIGLFTLFVSITFMMVAFGAALHLVLLEKDRWLLVSVAALACLPVASFVLLQFPLLVDVVYSTYGPGIFGNKTGHILY